MYKTVTRESFQMTTSRSEEKENEIAHAFSRHVLCRRNPVKYHFLHCQEGNLLAHALLLLSTLLLLLTDPCHLLHDPGVFGYVCEFHSC